MRSVLASALLIGLLAACSDPAGVTVPEMTGHWLGATEPGEIPATLRITVLERDGIVTGAGVIFVVQAVYSLTLEGVHAYPEVSFKNSASGFADFNYTGRFENDSTIVGTLRGSGFAGETVVLVRQR